MRRLVFALLLVTLKTTPALAQEGQWAEKLFTEAKSSLSKDFGSVPRGTQLYHKFELKNFYQVPLELNLVIGCNCVTATANPKVLQPGEQGVIEITMDTRRFPGVRKVNISVTTGPEYISTAVLSVTANSRTDVVLNPGQISFGVVSRGAPGTPQSLDVEYAGVLDWQVKEVAKTSAPVNVEYKELYRRPGQVGYRVTVSLKADAPPGNLKEEIFLKTNDPSSPLLPILVEANVQANLRATPETLRLGTLKAGESISKSIIVKGHKPFRITSVDGSGDGVTADLPVAAAQVQRVLIKFQPAKAGPVRKQLKFKTDLEKEGPVTVTVEGTADPSE